MERSSSFQLCHGNPSTENKVHRREGNTSFGMGRLILLFTSVYNGKCYFFFYLVCFFHLLISSIKVKRRTRTYYLLVMYSTIFNIPFEPLPGWHRINCDTFSVEHRWGTGGNFQTQVNAVCYILCASLNPYFCCFIRRIFFRDSQNVLGNVLVLFFEGGAVKCIRQFKEWGYCWSIHLPGPSEGQPRHLKKMFDCTRPKKMMLQDFV